MQKIFRRYKEETGEKEVDMRKVADYALKMGWPRPKPPTAEDLLAREFSAAAREELRYDRSTGKPYRANHAYQTTQGGQQLTLWVDIDEAPREPMRKSLVNRREQMVGDAVQLTLDVNHWNSVHPHEERITIPMDFTDDVEWRLNSPDDDAKAA